jgi:hypothetical protein
MIMMKEKEHKKKMEEGWGRRKSKVTKKLNLHTELNMKLILIS